MPDVLILVRRFGDGGTQWEEGHVNVEVGGGVMEL